MNPISGIQDPANFNEKARSLIAHSSGFRCGYTIGNGTLSISATFCPKEEARREIARAFLEENHDLILAKFGQSLPWEVAREFPRLRLQIGPLDLGAPASWDPAIMQAVTQLDSLVTFLRPCVLEIDPGCTIVMQRYNGIPLHPDDYEAVRELHDSDGTRWLTGEWSRGAFDLNAEKGRITSLDLSGREFGVLPKVIGNLAGLRRLDLRGNGLSDLPAALGNLASLAELNLARNGLTVLPDVVCNLVRLEKLTLDENRLTALPACISNMASLRELSVRDNKLKLIPKSLAEITALQVVDVTLNPIRSLPHAVRRMVRERNVSLLGADYILHARNS
jgi:Leucine-rich repeat (LRR) protein